MLKCIPSQGWPHTHTRTCQASLCIPSKVVRCLGKRAWTLQRINQFHKQMRKQNGRSGIDGSTSSRTGEYFRKMRPSQMYTYIIIIQLVQRHQFWIPLTHCIFFCVMFHGCFQPRVLRLSPGETAEEGCEVRKETATKEGNPGGLSRRRHARLEGLNGRGGFDAAIETRRRMARERRRACYSCVVTKRMKGVP